MRIESGTNAGSVDTPASAATTIAQECLRSGNAVGREKSSGV
jgi:hypothetical protein